MLRETSREKLFASYPAYAYSAMETPMKTFRFAWMLAALPLGTTAYAQSLEQKNMIAQDKIQVAQYAAETNKKCGTNIAFSVDYPSFAGIKSDPDNLNQQSPWAYFANVTDALNSVCNTNEGKAAVKAKIQKVVVSHAKEESESLNGGLFHYNVSYKVHTVQSVEEWLNKNL
ncbi:hypothetical protein [Terriglobus sp.]|uniref:hypothetical protein n=1 Tax=Terriglobus sp. TaxID=1889013 RepID=UPI003AFF9BA3